MSSGDPSSNVPREADKDIDRQVDMKNHSKLKDMKEDESTAQNKFLFMKKSQSSRCEEDEEAKEEKELNEADDEADWEEDRDEEGFDDEDHDEEELFDHEKDAEEDEDVLSERFASELDDILNDHDDDDDDEYNEDSITGSASLDQFMYEQGMKPWNLDDADMARDFLANDDYYY